MDDIELARKTVQSAAWGARYHEDELKKAHQHLGLVKALLARAGLELESQKALAIYNEDEEGDNLSSSEDLAVYLLGEAMQNIDYHEEGLTEAFQQVAAVRALIIRAGLEDEISLAEEDALAKKRLAE